MLYILLGLLIGLVIYQKVIKLSKYWENRNVTHEPSWPPIGIFSSAILRRKHVTDIIDDIYTKHHGHRYVGFLQFNHPTLMIRDVELIKQITTKDFDHFHDHLAWKVSDRLLSKSLTSLDGHAWHQMRTTLGPAFTGSKLRTMYQLMAQCSEVFVNHFKTKESVAVQIKDVFSRFALDVIAIVAFGTETNSLNEPNNTFYRMSSRISQIGWIQIFNAFVLSKLIKVQVFTSDIADFFRSIIKDNINQRERDGIVRSDLIQSMLETRTGQLNHNRTKIDDTGFAAVEEPTDKCKDPKKLDDDDMVAQAILFFLSGFHTVSTAASFMAYELAINPDIQKKLQEEIDVVSENCKGKISYEALVSMKYLDQVVSETLRLWPPAFQLDRVCTKSYTIDPITLNESKILVEKGVSVMIPVIALHRDANYYPEPERFDPERFNEENRTKIKPGTYLPFGLGPRNCIGSRFALLELKTLFFHLLSKLDVVPIDKTQIPIKINMKEVNLQPES